MGSKKSMNYCYCCKSKIIWQSDFEISEFGGEDEGIVSVWSCPNCGADVYIVMKTEEDEDE